MRLEGRYVEFMRGRRVTAGKWVRMMAGVPEGCLDVGISSKMAFERKRRFEAAEKGKCSNFEYRVVP